MNKVKLERKNKADQKKIDAVLERLNKDLLSAKNDFFFCKAISEMKEIMEAEQEYWLAELELLNDDVTNDHSERIALVNEQINGISEFVVKLQKELEGKMDKALQIQQAMLNSHQLTHAVFQSPE